MSDTSINHDDIERIASKMERLGSQLSASERAILAAVIALASAAIGPAATSTPTSSVAASSSTGSVATTSSPGSVTASALTGSVAASSSTEKVLPADAELSIEDQMLASFTPGALVRSRIESVKLEP